MAIPLFLDREFQKDLRRLRSSGSQLAGWVSSKLPPTIPPTSLLQPKKVGADDFVVPSIFFPEPPVRKRIDSKCKIV